MAAPLRTYVALLRGINVGGKNIVSMRELAECFRELGYRDVRTYINSGNVIFRSSAKDPRRLERRIEAALEERFSTPIRVVVRGRDEIEALVREVDSTWKDESDDRRNVIFLAHEVDSERVLDGLRPKEGLESVRYVPGALLWSAKRDTLTRTEMLKLASRDVYKSMTIRNTNTTRRVYELMLEAEGREAPS